MNKLSVSSLLFTADPYQVNAANQVNIYTIAFATATNAVFGGEYTVNFTPNPITQAYVRTLFDPNSRYANRFFYDKLGRPVVSQNARQFNELDVFQNAKERKYSYMLYDGLGRVVEAGEKWENTNTTNHFANVFGTMVSGYYNPSVMDDAKLLAWINGDGPRKEVTKSYYDETLITGLPGDFTPNVLTQRKRIVHVTYEEEFDGNDQTFDHATHYDYDIHGNVKTLLQDNRKMAVDFASIATQRFKRMDYTYDLVSGNVHRMSVQNGEVDQWHHAYKYDADNRITHAYTNDQTPLLTSTSSATVLPQALENELTQNADWQQEASYFYYAHGPLARTEIGQDELQGCDYIYNLQGWMKGVNSTSLDETIDPGKDASTSLGNLNGNFAKDVYGFSLHYYEGDYLAINGTGQNHAASIANSDITANSFDLYNGNIRAMQTTLTNPDTRAIMPMANAYKYDQLNRLLESKSFINLANNQWGNSGTYDNRYYNAFEYDPNGNIESQIRHTESGLKIEEMTYQYQKDGNGNLLRNRLYHINDAVAAGVWADDIDDMGAFTTGITINTDNNYSFDEEGRLIRDVQEGIEEIVWRVDGKVKEVKRDSTSQKKNVSFDYDAFGNRIAKHVFDDNWMLEKSTYYVLDAQGNQLSMYEHEVDQQDVNYTLTERNIYGSSRLGRNSHKVDLYTADAENPVNSVLGEKYYELSNHLGNVLAVINDIKYPVATGSTVDYFEVGLVSVSDYSPFGVQLDGRTHQSSDYRYGYQGSEKIDEVSGEGNHYTTHYRGLDTRVVRWWSVDPKTSSMPWQSPYISMDNNPIMFNDPMGDIVEPTGTKREIRKINKIIQKGIKKSETYASQYKILNDSEDIHQIRLDDYINKDGVNKGSNLVVSGEDVSDVDENVKTVMFLNLKDIHNSAVYENGKYSRREKQIITSGHEMGHQVMTEQGINYEMKPVIPTMINNPNFGLKDKRARIPNPNFNEEKNKQIMLNNVNSTTIFNELGASLRENMIRKELDVDLRKEYSVGLQSDITKPSDINFDIPILLFQRIIFSTIP